MRKNSFIKKIFVALWALLSAGGTALFAASAAQKLPGVKFAGIVSIDKTVHDWGDVTTSDGPLSCTFTFTNISSANLIVKTVNKTCGCTSVSWTKNAVAPGEQGSISAVFSNDEGPYDFDKTLNVYFNDLQKPLILHLRGSVHSARLSLEECFPLSFGSLGLKTLSYSVGNMLQGEQKSMEFSLANLGSEPVSITWESADPDLTILPAVLEIPARSRAQARVVLRSNRSRFGRNIYRARPLVNSQKAPWELEFSAVSKENFAFWTAEQLANAPVADYSAEKDVYNVEAGKDFEAGFVLYNYGKSDLLVYKIDLGKNVEACLKAPQSLAPGARAELRFRIGSKDLESGSDHQFQVSLYTNDPNFSQIHLFIDAIIL